MNERIKELYEQSLTHTTGKDHAGNPMATIKQNPELFAELIIKDCIDKIEAYHIPVGNSSAGELACEWTYDALTYIRDDIKENFGIE